MNPYKICFIICTNNQTFLEECRFYIDRLSVPEGVETEFLAINGASSMLSGYRTGCERTDALYKVFMHQDVFILNQGFIHDILSIFDSDPDIGMIGMAGTTKIPANFVMWTGDRIGNLFVRNDKYKYSDYSYDVIKDGYTQAEAVDGLLMAVKGDPILRDDVFDGWDLYDLSMSFEMRLSGRKVVVPVQRMPWCLHDDGGVLSMLNYNKYRKRAIRLYGRSLRLIMMTGGFVTLDDFIYTMAEDTDAVTVNVKNPEETLGPIIDEINSDTIVVTFNNVGAGFALWKQRNVQLFNILVDHPAHYLEAVSSDYYPGYHALCIDKGHVEFLRSVFKNVPSAFSFMPHGGTDINGMNRDKDIDILYAGGYKNDEEINFAPLPFLDSEEFYDFAISYYDREDYIEAQYVVQEYCQQTGNDYSVEQKAIMTNYIARSVEYYFEAERRKGIIEYLAQRGFSVCLCGNEPWRDIAERYPGNVSYEGMLSPRECIEYISRTKVLINDLPYFAEGAHERVFNGMLNGAVVLSNPSRYLEERFTDKDSILYWDGRDYETAAAKIRQVLDDDGYRISIIQKARSLVENDTWKDRLRSILDL